MPIDSNEPANTPSVNTRVRRATDDIATDIRSTMATIGTGKESAAFTKGVGDSAECTPVVQALRTSSPGTAPPPPPVPDDLLPAS